MFLDTAVRSDPAPDICQGARRRSRSRWPRRPGRRGQRPGGTSDCSAEGDARTIPASPDGRPDPADGEGLVRQATADPTGDGAPRRAARTAPTRKPVRGPTRSRRQMTRKKIGLKPADAVDQPGEAGGSRQASSASRPESRRRAPASISPSIATAPRGTANGTATRPDSPGPGTARRRDDAGQRDDGDAHGFRPAPRPARSQGRRASSIVPIGQLPGEAPCREWPGHSGRTPVGQVADGGGERADGPPHPMRASLRQQDERRRAGQGSRAAAPRRSPGAQVAGSGRPGGRGRRRRASSRTFATAGAARRAGPLRMDGGRWSRAPGSLRQVRVRARGPPARCPPAGEEPGQRPQQRRLAGAVRTEQGHDFATAARQREVVEHRLAPGARAPGPAPRRAAPRPLAPPRHGAGDRKWRADMRPGDMRPAPRSRPWTRPPSTIRCVFAAGANRLHSDAPR